ncbi:MAG: hypothetical protein WC621_02770 [Patescibacteria group bacterium]
MKISKKFLGWIIGLGVLVIVVGLFIEYHYRNYSYTVSVGRIENVKYILTHERGDYTISAQKSFSSDELVDINVHSYNIRKFTDVPSWQLRWVAYKRIYKDPGGVVMDEYEFHLNYDADIGGAGWNHGKRGHGRTAVIY